MQKFNTKRRPSVTDMQQQYLWLSQRTMNSGAQSLWRKEPSKTDLILMGDLDRGSITFYHLNLSVQDLVDLHMPWRYREIQVYISFSADNGSTQVVSKPGLFTHSLRRSGLLINLIIPRLVSLDLAVIVQKRISNSTMERLVLRI